VNRSDMPPIISVSFRQKPGLDGENQAGSAQVLQLGSNLGEGAAHRAKTLM